MKTCGKCKMPKNKGDFSNSQFARGGGWCRECCSQASRERKAKRTPQEIEKDKITRQKYDAFYYQENKKEILEYKQEYYEENKEDKLEYMKTYHQEHKEERQEYSKNYYQQNREDMIADAKIYALEHQEEIKEYHNDYYKEKRDNDLGFRLKTNISANISFYLKSNGLSKNKKSTLKYLSYTIEELEKHLESQFEPWMTWNNYGKYNTVTWKDDDTSTWTWQIDHIVPHSTFKYTSMEDKEFSECWSLKNLRPLNAKQNFLEGVRRTRHNKTK